MFSQHRARRRTVAGPFGNLQRQTNQFVIAGFDLTEVQPFDDDYIIGEQSQVRFMIAGMKLFNSKIISAHQFHAHVHKSLGGLGRKMNKVFAKTLAPEARITRVKQHALNLV